MTALAEAELVPFRNVVEPALDPIRGCDPAVAGLVFAEPLPEVARTIATAPPAITTTTAPMAGSGPLLSPSLVMLCKPR